MAGYRSSHRGKEQIMPIVDLITRGSRATMRGHSDEKEEEAKRDQGPRKERNRREGCTQGKEKKVLQECGQCKFCTRCLPKYILPALLQNGTFF